METAALSLQVNAKGAVADLGALSRALGATGTAFANMEKKFEAGGAKTEAALQGAVKAAERAAAVANLLNKVKVDPAAAGGVREFAAALDQLGRVKSISEQKITSIRQFLVMVAAIKPPSNIGSLAAFVKTIDSIRAPSAATITRLREFLQVIDGKKISGTAISAGMVQTLREIAAIKPIPQATTTRLKEMLNVLAGAKQIPGAKEIARDLDLVAAAAGRASAALARTPPQLRAMSNAAQQAGVKTREAAEGINVLNGRFSMGYQLGTLFTSMFASFTIGEFVRGVYEVGVQVQKMAKSLEFATGTMQGAQDQMKAFFAFATSMGLSIDKTADSYSRFSLATAASGMTVAQSFPIYKSISTALQVVGANSDQARLALYALTEMFQKGTVQSKEFIRQFAAQVPGAVSAGAQAMTVLKGHIVTTGELLEMMAKKQINPMTFLPELAKQLDGTINQMKKLASIRPDAQLNNIGNAFFQFKKEVGDSGFIAALTTELHGLFGKIISPDGNLSSQAKELADTLGKNLASGVHILAEGLGFLVTHIHDVVSALKGIATLSIASTFLNWSHGAAGFVDQLVKTKGAAIAAQFAMKPSAAAGVVGAASFGGQSSSPGMATAMAMRTQMTGAGAGALSGVARAAAGGLGLAKNAFMAIGQLMPSISTLLVGGAIALAVFGDKMTGFQTAAGNAINFADVVMGAFDMIFGGLAHWLKTLGIVVDDTGGSTQTFATYIALLGASVKAVFGTIFAVVQDMGEHFGLFIVDIIHFGEIIKDIAQGKLGAAKTLWDQNAAQQKKASEDYDKKTGATIRDDIDLKKSVADAMADAAKRADARAAPNHDNDLANLAKAMEGPLAAMRAQDAAALAEGQKEADARGAHTLDLFTTPLNFESIMKDLADPAGAYKRNHSDLSGASKTPAEIAVDASKDAAKHTVDAGATFAKTVTDAGNTLAAALHVVASQPSVATDQSSIELAPGVFSGLAGKKMTSAPGGLEAMFVKMAAAAGIDPNMLRLFAARESSFDPHAHSKTSNATGLFQFTNDTWTNDKGTGIMQGHALSERENPEIATEAFIKLVKQNQLKLKAEIGRLPTAGEIYEAHFLGPVGAGKLINAVTKNPSINAAMAIYGSTTAKGVLANKEIFANGNATAGQLDKNLLSTMGEARTTTVNSAPLVSGAPNAAVAGAALAAMGPDPANTDVAAATASDAAMDKADKSILALQKEGEALLSHDPGLGGQAIYNEFLEKLNDLSLKLQEVNKGTPGAHYTPEQLAMIRQAGEQQLKESIDKSNPLGKDNRLADQSYQADFLRMSGKVVEADWLTKTNALAEQGYTLSQEILNQEHARFVANALRLDQLKDEGALHDAQRNAQLKLIEATQSSAQAMLAQQVLAAYPGMSLADAMKKASADGRLGTMQATAAVDTDSTKRLSMIQQSNAISEANSTAGLTGTDLAYRENLKASLEGLEGAGAAGKTLQQMTAMASSDMLTFAANAAKAKTELEHPPGFAAWVDGLKPFSDALEDIKKSFMDTLSNNIVDALSGKKVDWKKSMYDLSRQVLKAQVDQELAGGLKLLGIGGPKKGDAAINGVMAAGTDAAGGKASAAVTLNTAGVGLNTAAQNLNIAAQSLANVGGAAGGGVATMSTMRGGGAAGSPSISIVTSGAGGAMLTPSNDNSVDSISTSGHGMDIGVDSNGHALQASSGGLASLFNGMDSGVNSSGQALQATSAGISSLWGGSGSSGGIPALLGGPEMDSGVDASGSALQASSAGIAALFGGSGGGSSSSGSSATGLGSTAFGAALGKAMGGSTTLAGPMGGSTTLAGPMGGSTTLAGPMGGSAPLTGLSSPAFGAALGASSFNNLSGATSFMNPDGTPMADPSKSITKVANNPVMAALEGLGGKSGGAAGGSSGVGGIANSLGTLFGGSGSAAGGVLNSIGSFLSPGGGPLGLGGMAGTALTAMLSSALAPKPEAVSKHVVNGVIGTPSTQTMSGTEIAGHPNLIGSILDQGLSAATGGFGAKGPGGAPTSFGGDFSNIMSNLGSTGSSLMSGLGNVGSSMMSGMGDIGSFFAGLFSEGGYSTSPVSRAALSAAQFASAPHYADGTTNTSGGMPAILHPDEAVVPLSRGRSIPVDLGDSGGGGNTTHVHATTNIYANDADSFRKSGNAIDRQNNATMRRAAIRNGQAAG